MKTRLRAIALRMVESSPFERQVRELFLRFAPGDAGRFDRLSLQVFTRALSEESNAVDVGAYRGEILRQFLRLAPRGSHVAVEPVPRNAAYLREQFPSARIVEAAVAAQEGAAEFVHVPDRPARSGLKEVPYPSGDLKTDRFSVDVETLDRLLPSEEVAVIKIDVEGGELDALRGGRDLIRRSRPILLLEHMPTAAARYGDDSAELHRYITSELDLHVWTIGGWLAGDTPLSSSDFADDPGPYYVAASCVGPDA